MGKVCESICFVVASPQRWLATCDVPGSILHESASACCVGLQCHLSTTIAGTSDLVAINNVTNTSRWPAPLTCPPCRLEHVGGGGEDLARLVRRARCGSFGHTRRASLTVARKSVSTAISQSGVLSDNLLGPKCMKQQSLWMRTV